MQQFLVQLQSGQSLSRHQTREAFGALISGQADPVQVAALLSLLATRLPQVDELVGVAQVLREALVPIPLPPELSDAIDTCGTGGVGSNLLNVSTASAILAAACGQAVVKHGNRSVTSRSGSGDVLSCLGLPLELPIDTLLRSLRSARICFAWAPRHHPAMRHAAPIRKALGFPTIFNLVGPLANPAGVRRQLVGVGRPELIEPMAQALRQLGAKRSLVVHASTPQPTCELSIAGPTQLLFSDGEKSWSELLRPQDVGLPMGSLEALQIASPQESADRIRAIFSGQRSAARDMILLNTAAALWVGGRVDSIAQGLAPASEALDSGAALQTLETLLAQ